MNTIYFFQNENYKYMGEIKGRKEKLKKLNEISK